MLYMGELSTNDILPPLPSPMSLGVGIQNTNAATNNIRWRTHQGRHTTQGNEVKVHKEADSKEALYAKINCWSELIMYINDNITYFFLFISMVKLS